MKRFRSILVAVDTRLDDHPIVDEAVEMARRNDATLKLVDVVPEFSWTVRLTLKDHEHIRELIAREKREKLAALVERLSESGLSVDTRVMLGKSSTEIIREVLRSGHDLVMRVAKGSDSTRRGFFGTTGLGLLRNCPCAVWLVSPKTTPRFEHVLGCVNTSSDDALDAQLNDMVYQLASAVSEYHKARFSLIHTWSIFGERMIRSRMKPEDFVSLEQDIRERTMEQLNTFLKKHGSHIDAPGILLERGDAASVISEFVRSEGVDLVVMGTVARSGLAGVLVGNTAERILDAIECSVLALKPAGFISPVKLDD